MVIFIPLKFSVLNFCVYYELLKIDNSGDDFV